MKPALSTLQPCALHPETLQLVTHGYFWTVSLQVTYMMEVDPSCWANKQITFKTCDDVDEILLVMRFIIKHNIDIAGSLTVTFYRNEK